MPRLSRLRVNPHRARQALRAVPISVMTPDTPMALRSALVSRVDYLLHARNRTAEFSTHPRRQRPKNNPTSMETMRLQHTKLQHFAEKQSKQEPRNRRPSDKCLVFLSPWRQSTWLQYAACARCPSVSSSKVASFGPLGLPWRSIRTVPSRTATTKSPKEET